MHSVKVFHQNKYVLSLVKGFHHDILTCKRIPPRYPTIYTQLFELTIKLCNRFKSYDVTLVNYSDYTTNF